MYDIYRKAFKCIDIDINKAQIDALLQYAECIKSVNQVINLTAVDDDDGILWRHFVDSCRVLRYLPLNPTDSFVDIGSGAGFPGLPLAIISGSKATLIDALNKRVQFLNNVVTSLTLNNVVTLHARAEEIGRLEQYRAQFDYAFSRAVTALPILIEYAAPLLKVGGTFIAYKADDISDEINSSRAALNALNCKISKISEYTDNLDIKRKLLFIEKISETPPKYPRRAGIASKRPIK